MYEPRFNYANLNYPLTQERELIGIDLNVNEQLSLLEKFSYSGEILALSKLPNNKLTYSFVCPSFKSGDSDYLYNIVRHFKPNQIIEIGSGHSTLMVQHAMKKNKEESANYTFDHLCIEPFEVPWLEELPVQVIRKMVENIDISFFRQLEENDILFIDSSHIIRPQGDVLYEYLQILPNLKKGVIVHIHDIFTPYDYLPEWFEDGVVFWNEQYLLEAFLTLNPSFKIIGSLNYLKNKHYESLKGKCPMLTSDRQPGSFWIQKTN
jgi:hypothetical protein